MKCTFFSRIWHQNETEIFSERSFIEVWKNKEFKIHQTSTGRIKANLQLFADNGEKTEKATPRKRSKAREEGQVLQSRN